MIKKEKNSSARFFFVSKILLLGLLATQLISTLHVYFANIEFYENTLRVLESGYLSVPNAKTLPQVKTLISAFCGGLFFTFTIGCFLSLVSFIYVWLWCRLCQKKMGMLFPGIVIWITALWFVNDKWFLPMVTAYFLVIPLIVGVATLKWMPEINDAVSKKIVVFSCLPFAILVIMAFYHINGRVFIDFRDTILLSNPIGMKVNDFYYKYTLYPAEIFKPFEKKLIKTSRLENIKEKSIAYQLDKNLRLYDYLPISGSPVDLTLSKTHDLLDFKYKEKTVLSIPLKNFNANPYTYLKEFSDITDGYAFFRKVTFISLVMGLPMGIFVLIYGAIQFIISIFTSRNAAFVSASILCMVMGLGMLFLLQTDKRQKDPKQSITEQLASSSSFKRTSVIKEVFRKGLDITAYPLDKIHFNSTYIPERYWLAMALSLSQSKDAEKYLFQLIDDPSVNVKCKVYYALGKKKNRSHIPLLLRELENSDYLYEQLYAYNALKELGWKQTTPR